MSARAEGLSPLSEHPLISVVIPTRNRPAFLKEAVRSVLAQSYSRWELVIVDDSETPAAAASLDLRGTASVLFLSGGRLGKSAARNQGIGAARGEIVAFLDDDDLWLPGWLEAGVSAFRAHPNAGVVRGQVREVSVKTGKARPIHHLPVGFNTADSLAEMNCASPSGAMVRKQCLQAVGGFDENLGIAEDLDLFLRLADKFPCLTIGEELVIYRVHSAGSRADLYPFLRGEVAYYESLRAKPLRNLSRAPVEAALEGWHRSLMDFLIAEGGSRPEAARSVAAALSFWFSRPRHWLDGRLPARCARAAALTAAGSLQRRGWGPAARLLQRSAGFRPSMKAALELWREHSTQSPGLVVARGAELPALSARPLVSVVIPTRDRPEFLKEAVESVRAQTYLPWELIVVDDGSRTPVGEALCGRGEPGARLIRLPRGLGVSAARNRGIQEARGEIVAFLDDDDLWLPGYLESGVRAFHAHPGIGMVRSRMRGVDLTTGRSWSIGRIKPGRNHTRQLLDLGATSPSGVMVDKRGLDRIGCFDEDLSASRNEDLDLYLRLAGSHGCFTTGEELAIYRLHETGNTTDSGSFLAGLVFYFERSFQRPPRGLTRADFRDGLGYWYSLLLAHFIGEGGSPQAPRYARRAFRFWLVHARHLRWLPRLCAHATLVTAAASLESRGLRTCAAFFRRAAGPGPRAYRTFLMGRLARAMNSGY